LIIKNNYSFTHQPVLSLPLHLLLPLIITMTSPHSINATTARYCYLDIDIDQHRQRLATAAAFVHACNTRYGLSSNDWRQLGGSERARLPEWMQCDPEWSTRCPSISSSHSNSDWKPLPCGQRIVIELYWHVAPLACENFATLCAHGSPSLVTGKVIPAPVGDSGKPLTYRQSRIHRLIPGFILQGGDFVMGNGSGGESIYGKKFKDERAGLQLLHDRRGLVSMGNAGKHANTSQFFMTLAPTPSCNGKHVIFGTVVSGDGVLAAAEDYQRASGTTSETPCVPMTITDCGIWQAPWMTPGAGYWYDAPDPAAYTGTSPVFAVQVRLGVVVPNESVWTKFQSTCRYAILTQIMVSDSDTTATSIQQGQEHMTQLLESFAVDVIVVAPACVAVLQSYQLPSSWTDADRYALAPPTLEQVVFEAKPVEAWTKIRSQAWIFQRTTRAKSGNPWHIHEMA
jgi:peptidylprolyl isomerase